MASIVPHQISLLMPLKPQQYLAPLLILFGSLFAYLFEQQLSNSLIYDRLSIAQDEWWRFFSAHFFHTNLYHFLLNALMLVLLWALQGYAYTIRSYLAVFFVSALFSCLGIHYFSPELSQYVGLSGALHGIFVWSVLQDIARNEKLGYILLFGIILKITAEQFYGASTDLSELISAKVAINAHLWGAIGGALMFFVIYYRNKRLKGAHI